MSEGKGKTEEGMSLAGEPRRACEEEEDRQVSLDLLNPPLRLDYAPWQLAGTVAGSSPRSYDRAPEELAVSPQCKARERAHGTHHPLQAQTRRDFFFAQLRTRVAEAR